MTVYCCSLNYLNTHKSDFDARWAIVRSLRASIPGVRWVPELSPSTQLFYQYCAWKKQGEWGKQKFEEGYKPVFIHDIQSDPEAQALLDEIVAMHEAGLNIALACFCSDYETCHRSIIADMLRERNVPVIVQ